MERSGRRPWAKWLGVLACVVVGLLMVAAPAFAAASGARVSGAGSAPLTTSALAAAPFVTLTNSNSPTSTTTTTTDNPDLGYAALGFGFAAVCVILLFIRKDRSQTLMVQEHLVAQGALPQPQNVSDTGAEGATVPRGLEEKGAFEQKDDHVIEGPDDLQVGASADFVAKVKNVQDAATWTAQPPDVVHVPAEPTSRATITALKAGHVKLYADNGPAKQIVVSAASSRQPPQGLLFIGVGWGHVVVAIIIASTTAALGLSGVLTGEAVATILGALVGYVVAKSQSDSDGGHTSGGTADHPSASEGSGR